MLLVSKCYVLLVHRYSVDIFHMDSVENNTRKLNRICSGRLYPFSPDSMMEHILATTNESKLGNKV